MNGQLKASSTSSPEATATAPLRQITAIVRTSMLEDVERRLRELDVPGISVTKVKGYGEYANFFTSDWSVEHARIEIVLPRECADGVARAVVAAARTGEPGDGIVVVLPVESLYRVRTGHCTTAGASGDRRASAAHTRPAH